MTDFLTFSSNYPKGNTMGNYKKYCSDFLFPNTSFLTGFGSVFNVFGNYYTYNGSKSGLEADRKALMSDMGVVGRDIYGVLNNLVGEEELDHSPSNEDQKE